MPRRATALAFVIIGLVSPSCRHVDSLSDASSHVVAPVGDRCSWEARHEDGSCGIYEATLGELLAVPDKFHGKPVRVRGFVTLTFEGNTICESNTPAAGCPWLQVSGVQDPGFRKGWAEVEGTFDGEDRGHLGCCSGAVVRLSRLAKLHK
jgi:hypothetical protein